MNRLVVNCRNLPFTSTLGVAHVLLNLCEALAKDHDLVFVTKNIDDINQSPAGEQIRAIASQIITVDDAERAREDLTQDSIEILPHHFQGPEFGARSILICHDMHVFDIPWKYGDRANAMQESFRRNLVNADAVMAHFPRTYYEVERIAGIVLMNLFLTESPLLLDTQSALREPQGPSSNRARQFLYPAQLQAHKNHEALVRGVQALKGRGMHVTITCPGSEHDAKVTERLASFVAESDVADSFRFMGRVSDDKLVDLYRDCDAVIVPSLAEGGAYVPLEAIGAGKPVAVHDIDSARMHVEAVHGEVIWFDATDHASTADAMARLASSDPRKWFERNARCRKRISELSWESVADKWNLVIDMLEGTRRRPVLAVDRTASNVVYS